MRAGIYIRVSTEDQARHGYSLEEQRGACEARARQLGAAEITVFADEGISGEVLDRPGLSDLRDAVRTGRVGLVLLRDADRLSRRMVHQLLLAEEFKQAGARVEFLESDYQDSPEGQLFFSIRAAVAEYEKGKIRDRMLRGKIQKARQGGIPVNLDIFGYTRSREGGLGVDAREAGVVREIFGMFVLEGVSPDAIARILTGRGVSPPRRGTLWRANTIRTILRQSAYTGTWYYGRHECRNMGQNRPRHARGRRRLRPRAEWVSIPVPPILDDESLWFRAQEILENARRLWCGQRRRFYLLTGLLHCRTCGGGMHGVYRRNWGQPDRFYTCRVRRSDTGETRGCVKHNTVRASDLEEAVLKEIGRWSNNPARVIKAVREASCGTQMIARELEKLETDLAETEKGRSGLVQAIAAGLLDLDPETKRRLTEVKVRREKLLRRREELRSVLESPIAIDEKRLNGLCRFPVRLLLDDREKQAVLRTLVNKITLHRTEDGIHLVLYPAFTSTSSG